jgi:hypothetical protein
MKVWRKDMSLLDLLKSKGVLERKEFGNRKTR